MQEKQGNGKLEMVFYNGNCSFPRLLCFLKATIFMFDLLVLSSYLTSKYDARIYQQRDACFSIAVSVRKMINMSVL